MQSILALIVLLVALCGVVTAKDETCILAKDCRDAGTTCIGGKCTCWTDLGAAAADAWSCDSDSKCQVSFPGHVCRVSSDCAITLGRKGYCQPV
ncbi:uncharacterized protein LOC129591574 [Paramacrobiotus metropolitanus]|uniref:uncharacterized protein LOC129591574 n=1 Tax=Paramacrobiotus metropolitanus TaxID=2943436 RepID=UPI0024459E3D|nr:uncharacterized protein LOC129591574 [Paramacrobiotus metropolitanus]